jgi:hypothetical protein
MIVLLQSFRFKGFYSVAISSVAKITNLANLGDCVAIDNPYFRKVSEPLDYFQERAKTD